MFKKIHSRKVWAFFLLHFTFCIMYYFNARDLLIWGMLGNAFGFISFNALEKLIIRKINSEKTTQE